MALVAYNSAATARAMRASSLGTPIMQETHLAASVCDCHPRLVHLVVEVADVGQGVAGKQRGLGQTHSQLALQVAAGAVFVRCPVAPAGAGAVGAAPGVGRLLGGSVPSA